MQFHSFYIFLVVSGRIQTALLLITLISSVAFGQLQAQSVRELAVKDLTAMQQPFSSCDEWLLQTEISYFDAPQGGNLLETTHSTIMQSKGLRYEKHEQEEFLIARDFHVIVDHEWKTLSIAPKAKGSSTSPASLPSAQAMLHGCDRVEKVPATNGHQGYVFRYPAGEYEKVEIRFDAQNGKCRSLVYFFRNPLSKENGGSGQKPRMEIHFSKTDFSPSFQSDQFAIGKYCSIKGNTARPAAAYSDYQIIY